MLEGEDRKETRGKGLWLDKRRLWREGCPISLSSGAHSACRKHRGDRAVPAPWHDSGDQEEVLSLPVLG